MTNRHFDATREITEEEVSKHNTGDSLWVIHNGKVYDMTAYFPEHPGGKAMLRQAGKDATMAMRAVTAHGVAKDFIKKKLDSFCIGILAPPSTSTS